MAVKSVSVIIPVYNAELFLEACVRSVLDQSYPVAELLLINDGSTDRSGEICERFAEEDARIRVIHQANAGPSAARNKGIQAAEGEYIQFIDSDDTIHPEMIERFMAAIGTHPLLVCGYRRVQRQNGRTLYSHQPLPLEGEFSNQEFLRHFMTLYPHFFIHYTWNKCYLTSFVKEAGLRFDPELSWGEDLLFNLEVIERCSSLRLIGDELYDYTHSNGDSITSQFRVDFFDNMQIMQNMARAFLKRNGSYHGETKDQFEQYYITRIMLSFWNLFHPKSLLTEEERKQHIASIVQDAQVRGSLPCFFGGDDEKRLVGELIDGQAVDRLHEYFLAKTELRLQQETEVAKWI